MSASIRLSKSEAAQRALDLARAHVASVDARGWSWECGAASPDPINPDCRGRKTPRRWVVPVQWSKDSAILDGPGIILVDVETGDAQLQETL